jgi:hypothetical protein
MADIDENLNAENYDQNSSNDYEDDGQNNNVRLLIAFLLRFV